MGIRKHVSKGFSKVITPTQWVGLDSLKQNGRLIGGMAKTVFSLNKQRKSKKLTFEQAMEHYHLSEQDIQQKMKKALQIVWFCLGLSALLFGYGIYLFIVSKTLPALVCVILLLVMLAQAFREHFNYFQMDQRRLGCTYPEWWHYLTKGRRK